MKLVDEDEHGAYLGVRKEFLKKFVPREINPNFEVYDSRDGDNRFMASKCSRLPDDDDPAAGRYGIDFHRAKPTLQQSLKFGTELPHSLKTRQFLSNCAFSAVTEEEYKRKSSVWDSFYSYIWDYAPLTIWVTPHTGSVNRKPDDILPYPKLELDAYSAGTAALCASKHDDKAIGRLMISIHSHNWFGAVLELGGFEILEEQKLNAAAKNIEDKYHEKVQTLADECKKDFSLRANNWLKHIYKKKGTLAPQELGQNSNIDRIVVLNIVKCLELYGGRISEFTLEEFKTTIQHLKETDIKVTSFNHLFPGKHISSLLRLNEKVKLGLMSSALQIECLKLYLAKAPDLMSDIILDIKKELFG